MEKCQGSGGRPLPPSVERRIQSRCKWVACTTSDQNKEQADDSIVLGNKLLPSGQLPISVAGIRDVPDTVSLVCEQFLAFVSSC